MNIVATTIAGCASRRGIGLGAALAVTLLLGAGVVRADAAERSPHDMVRETSDAVLSLIEEAREYAQDDPERFYREVQALLDPVVDFESFARSVMAVHYRNATPAQRKRFTDSFRSGLVRTYALALTEFEDGEVVVLPPDRPPRDPRRQTVTMQIKTPQGAVYPVLYSVVQDRDGEWKVRNLIVNGVNIGLTFRNQFNSAAQDPKYGGDLDRVIDDWADLIEDEQPGFDAPADTDSEHQA